MHYHFGDLKKNQNVLLSYIHCCNGCKAEMPKPMTYYVYEPDWDCDTGKMLSDTVKQSCGTVKDLTFSSLFTTSHIARHVRKFSGPGKRSLISSRESEGSKSSPMLAAGI